LYSASISKTQEVHTPTKASMPPIYNMQQANCLSEMLNVACPTAFS